MSLSVYIDYGGNPDNEGSKVVKIRLNDSHLYCCKSRKKVLSGNQTCSQFDSDQKG